ncbi:MAG: hypothetical protein HY597_00065, partial [Candidatus Omnitrophica bacterium]|nr:hypothetical protein [Candidatus Omnitrophota bacterium]
MDDDGVAPEEMSQSAGLLLEEPPLEVALPGVFAQPACHAICRGKIHAERVLARAAQSAHEGDGVGFSLAYQELLDEFQPLLRWAIASWDYLLTMEGCKFLERSHDERRSTHGHYRPFLDRDFSRLIHRQFKTLVLQYVPGTNGGLHHHLTEQFWPAVVAEYRELDRPADARQRRLTPYSYLRRVPYEFLNDYHHERVTAALARLPEREQRFLHRYFFEFCSDGAIAEELQLQPQTARAYRRQAFSQLLAVDRLAAALLRQ